MFRQRELFNQVEQIGGFQEKNKFLDNLKELEFLGKIRFSKKNNKMEVFEKTEKLKHYGVCYVLVDNGEIVYVGMTTRSFINRFYEHNSDYKEKERSLLKQYIKKNKEIEVFGILCKKRLVEILGKKREKYDIHPRDYELEILNRLKKKGFMPFLNRQM